MKRGSQLVRNFQLFDITGRLIKVYRMNSDSIELPVSNLVSGMYYVKFSIDGVLGAFAFTLSVPLILFGSGIGAIIVRELTIANIDRVKKYVYLKNGAMYSVFCLGLVMIAEGFGVHVPEWLAPALTFIIIGYFFQKSRRALVHNLVAPQAKKE